MPKLFRARSMSFRWSLERLSFAIVSPLEMMFSLLWLLARPPPGELQRICACAACLRVRSRLSLCSPRSNYPSAIIVAWSVFRADHLMCTLLSTVRQVLYVKDVDLATWRNFLTAEYVVDAMQCQFSQKTDIAARQREWRIWCDNGIIFWNSLHIYSVFLFRWLGTYLIVGYNYVLWLDKKNVSRTINRIIFHQEMMSEYIEELKSNCESW